MAGNPHPTPEAVGTHRCPNCGSPVELRLGADTLTATCGSCGAELDTSGQEWQVLRTVYHFQPPNLVIPLGARGTLFGHEWEMVGWVERYNKAYPEYPWQEFLLFNPWQGYRWLVLSNGHWNFVEPVVGIPRLNKAGLLVFKNQPYRPFLGGVLVVRRIWGEFYWRLKVGDRAWGEDFIAPPHILTLERTAQDLSWGKGTYLAPHEVKQAFGLASVPHPEGVAANQVNPWPRRFRFFWLATLVWVAVLLGIQLGVEALQPPEYVHVTTTRVEHTFETLYTSPQFAIPRETGNVRVEMTAEGLPSHYDLHVKAVLVNLETQQRYAAPLHFMAGEMLLNGQGQPTAEWYLQDIPGGRYVLEYNCYTLLDQPFTARIGVVRDAPRWDNFVMLMLLWPVIALVMWIQKSSFEKKRWNDSDVPALRNPPNYESL